LQQKTRHDLTGFFLIEAYRFRFGVLSRAINTILAVIIDGLISAAKF
jgi:hypothetical protein